MKKNDIKTNPNNFSENDMKLRNSVINTVVTLIFDYIPIILLGVFSILIWFVFDEPVAGISILDLGNIYSLVKGEYLDPIKSLYMVIAFAALGGIFFLVAMFQKLYRSKVLINNVEYDRSKITSLIAQLIYVAFIVFGIVINYELEKEGLDQGVCSKYMIILSSITLFTSLICFVAPYLLFFSNDEKYQKNLIKRNKKILKKFFEYTFYSALIVGALFGSKTLIENAYKKSNTIFQANRLKDFRINETTKEDIIKKLGEPFIEEQEYIEYYDEYYINLKNRIIHLDELILSSKDIEEIDKYEEEIKDLEKKLRETEYKYIYISFTTIADENDIESIVLKEIFYNSTKKENVNMSNKTSDKCEFIGTYYYSTYDTEPIYPQVYYSDGSFHYGQINPSSYTVSNVFKTGDELQATYRWSNDFVYNINVETITLVDDR